jgi:ribosome biogenesis GTPase
LLDEGGLLLDVPGLRELGIADTGDSLADVFDDVEALTTRCRFTDCGHRSEPGCAVREAIASGRLDERRLGNYEKLLREEARNTATLSEQRHERRRFAKRVRQVVKEKERFRPT